MKVYGNRLILYKKLPVSRILIHQIGEYTKKIFVSQENSAYRERFCGRKPKNATLHNCLHSNVGGAVKNSTASFSITLEEFWF